MRGHILTWAVMAGVIAGVVAGTASPAWAVVFNGPNNNVAIPDNAAGLLETINVVGGPTDIEAFRVVVNITHQFDSDLVIYLLPPGVSWGANPVVPGAVPPGAIALSLYNGLFGVNFSNTIFTGSNDGRYDPTEGPISIGVAPFTGTYSPDGVDAFDKLYGTDSTGAWSLVIIDTAPGDTGTLVSWAMEFDTGIKPTIAVRAFNQPVAYGSLINVPPGTTLASMNFQVTVDDPGLNDTNLTASIGNMNFEGLVETEFERAAAAVPYTLMPATGRFPQPGKVVVVVLTATNSLAMQRQFPIIFNIRSGTTATDTPMLLPDGPAEGITSTITVANAPTVATSIRVTFNISHPLISDVDVWLLPPGVNWGLNPVRPGNQPAGAIELSTGNGLNGQNYQNTSITRSDDPNFGLGGAQQNISVGNAPFTGTWSAEATLDFSGLYGTNPNGTWSLVVIDNTPTSFGRLDSWTIDVPTGRIPTVSVNAFGTPVANGGTVTTTKLDTLAAMNLQITVDDANGNNTKLDVFSNGVTTEDFALGQFVSSARPVPYTLSPTQGSFPNRDVDLQILFVADDGQGNRGYFAFTIHVNPQPITVVMKGVDVVNGSTTNVLVDSTVGALNMQIMVFDPQNDATTLNAVLNGVTTEGLVQAQFSTVAQPTPYTMTPNTGTFNVAGADITIDLTSNDGNGNIFNFSFTIHVQPNFAPTFAVTINGAPVGDGTIATVTRFVTVTQANIQITIDDENDFQTPALSATITNLTNEGIVIGEFISAPAAVPYTVHPTSGTFANLTDYNVTLTADDGFGGVTTHNFILRVVPPANPTSGKGCGALPDATASPMTAALALLLLATFAAYRRRPW